MSGGHEVAGAEPGDWDSRIETIALPIFGGGVAPLPSAGVKSSEEVEEASMLVSVLQTMIPWSG